MILCAVGLEAFVPEGEMCPLGDTTMIPLSRKLDTTWPLWAPHASKSVGEEESYGVGQGD